MQRSLALIVILLGLNPLTTSASALARFEFSKPQMGVPFRIVLYASSPEKAEAAARKAFSRVEELNQILSDYEYDSELSTLSRTAGSHSAVPLSPDLWNVLSRAQALSAETDGAFDITVGPLTSLWRKARREKQMPSPDKLSLAQRSVGWKLLHLDPKKRTATLLTNAMRLDLGSIAKGYAVDEAMKSLKQSGIRSALVAAAGDILVSKAPPKRKGWDISVGAFDTPDSPQGFVLSLSHRAVCSSGDFFQKLEIDGKRYSHIVDPKTGIGLTDHSLVTAIADDAITANTWATAISVMGPTKGLAKAESHGGLAVHIRRQPNSTIDTFNSRLFRKRYLRSK